MLEHQFRIAEIEVSRSLSDEKIIGFFRYDGAGKKKASTMLVIAEIASTLYAYERLLDVINSTVEQTRLLVAGVEQDSVIRFEKIIQRLNDRIATFLAGEPTPLHWNRVNLFIIDLADDHICFTGVGRLMNLFLQKQEDSTFATYDLLGSLEQPADVDPQKVFSSLVCGDMKPGDVLVAGTNNFERIRNELEFKQRLTTLPPVSAAMEIKQALETRGIPDDFLAVIIASCALEKPMNTPANPDVPDALDKSTASVMKLRETEQETMQHLAPTLVPTAAAEAPRSVLDRVKHGLASLRERDATARMTEKLKDATTMTSLRGMSAGHGSRFTRKHLITTIGAASAVVLAIAGVAYWKHRQNVALAEAAWQEDFGKAQENRNRAESDLVYGNDGRATKELVTATQLLGALDTSTSEHRQKIETLKKDVAQLRERVRRLVNVDTPTELVSLSGASDGSLRAPVLWKNSAYAVDTSSRTILKVDLDSKNVKKIELPQTADTIIAGTRGKAGPIFVSQTGALYSVDATSDAVTALSAQSRASSTTDLVLYSGKTYALDGTTGQIWRAGASSNGFSAPQSYIKAANVSLAGAVGLAIDSNVYVLLPNGTVARFLSGGQEGFDLATIDPPLRSASGIWAGIDVPRILITDPADKRILAFTKDGALKAQITSSAFTAPRDVDSDEAGKIILLIDGNRLLSVPMP